MAVLKAMTSGGVRRELDFYPTPPLATKALLPLIAHWPGDIWEPCCGDGAIARLLTAVGCNVFATDLVDRGYGEGGRDFFGYTAPLAATIVTNPPFNMGIQFIEHAHKLGVKRMALLLKMDFWNAARHRRMFQLWEPVQIRPLTWRLDFTGAGRPHTNCMWCIWDSDDVFGAPIFEPLAKPVEN